MWTTGIIIWELAQEGARMPAIEFDQTTGIAMLGAQLYLRFCAKVDHRRRTGTSSPIEQFAWQLLQVAAEARPSARQAVDQLASMGLRDASKEVLEGSRDHNYLDVSSTHRDVGHVADGSHAESNVPQGPTKLAGTEAQHGPTGW